MPKARLVFDGDNVYIGKDGRIYGLKNDIASKIDGIPGVIDSLDSTSTTDALSANMGRDLQDQINAMSGIGTFLSTWDCTTGLPGTNPQEDPYTYKAGDYYVVSAVGATNYKPHGGTYTQGVPSTTVETENVGINDKYYFDGADWVRIPNTAIQITIDSALSTSSTNAVENRVVTNALNGKQATISDLATIRSGAAAGATALQALDNISELTNNIGYQTAGDVASAISTAIGQLPTVNDGVLTIQKNSTTIDTFSANSANNKTINIGVPTTVAELSDASDYATKTYVDDSVSALIPEGSTAPANPSEGDLWYDTVNHVLKIYNGTNWETVDTDTNTTYTAGNGINIDANNEISVDTSVVATQSDIPTVNNATLTIQKNSANVATFTANASSNVTADISVPTTVAELSDASNYATVDMIPTTVAELSDASDYATKTYVDTAISTVTSGSAMGTYIRAAKANGTRHDIDMGTDTTYTFGGMGYVLIKSYYGWACEINGVEIFKWTFNSGVYERVEPSLLVTMGPGDSVRLYRPGSSGGITYEVVDYYNEYAPTGDYLCFTAEEAGSTLNLHKVNSPNDVLLETSTDGDAWRSYTFGTDITLANVGDKVYFRNHSEETTNFSMATNHYYQFNMTGIIAASGDVNYLLNKNSTIILPNAYCFKGLFGGCSSLTTAPSLPATTLTEKCYAGMFLSCTGLTVAPSLSATALADGCYYEMFYNCDGLTTAPSLPATTLADNCYRAMFRGCTSLTVTPALPATTLAENCYNQMFRGCTSLTTVTSLPATTLAAACYYEMFLDCVSLVTITSLPATTLAASCYYQMFRGCTSLATIVSLPAETLMSSCYFEMFRGCTNIKLSTTQEGEYQTPYRIPTTGTGTTASSWNNSMFSGTGGTFTSNPLINTTYYTSNTII